MGRGPCLDLSNGTSSHSRAAFTSRSLIRLRPHGLASIQAGIRFGAPVCGTNGMWTRNTCLAFLTCWKRLSNATPVKALSWPAAHYKTW